MTILRFCSQFETSPEKLNYIETGVGNGIDAFSTLLFIQFLSVIKVSVYPL